MSTNLMILMIVATALNGILAGASLDQSIKQLPARHKIGLAAYSAYSQASDLSSGIAWYAIIGIGAALVTIITALVTLFQGSDLPLKGPLYIAALLSVLHSLMTTQAAPTLLSQRRQFQDETALREIFDRFERWQTRRVVLQVLTFGTLLWAIATSV